MSCAVTRWPMNKVSYHLDNYPSRALSTKETIHIIRRSFQVYTFTCSFVVIGPILRGHSGPLCHALSLSSLSLLLLL